MQALILAGGLGTRLASVVNDRAKPVAEVAGRPFLAHLLAQLARCREIDGVVLCVGHKAESVESALGDAYGRLPLSYSRESRPLGTGGALRLAAAHIPKGPVLVMNGDSFLGLSHERLIAFHRLGKPLVTLALARVQDAARYGAAHLDGERVISFQEKGRGGPAWINAGIYVVSQEALGLLRVFPESFSFERDALAGWSAIGRVRGLRCRGRFLDIGTPSDYARSATVLGRA
jgi:D-glycero-alpha-D-manno-heptose 1-phosphate guanylyltransferase